MRTGRAAGGGTAAIAIVACLSAPAAAGQHGDRAHAIPLELLQRPAALRQGIGVAPEPVTSSSPEAIALYRQGLAHLHSFAWIDAARAFHAALRHDSALAMAHLGLSFAFAGLGSADGAQQAQAQAARLAPGASERERLRIALRGQQLQTLVRPDDAAAGRAYLAALDAALAKFPDDVELLLLRGQGEEAASGPAAAVAFYQRAVRAAPDQFAAHHYLVHAYESAGRIEPALAEAEVYLKLAPAVPHAHHMLAHGLRRTGRTADALAAFRKAEELELAHMKAGNVDPAHEWHYHHNQALMAGALRYVGQLGAARERLRRAFEVPAPLLPEELAKREWPALLLASGAPDEALAAARRLTAHAVPLLRAAGHLETARIHMGSGRLEPGGAAADAALRELRAAGPNASVLAPQLRLVQGEFFLRGGEREKGRTMIRQGIESLRADVSPDGWSQTLFEIEALGRAARDLGDWPLAAELAGSLQQHDPRYAGTSYALGRAAEQRGDRAAAAAAYREAIERWAQADADHRDLIDARRRLGALTSAPR